MDNVKKVKRGEKLFSEGDLPQAIYLIQGGKVSLKAERTSKHLEIATAGPSQVVGEHALFSSARYEYSAEALQEVKVLEVPVELMKQQFEKCPVGIKLLVKSLVDDLKIARKFMKTVKTETEKTPVPQGLVHRLFTQVHLIARHIGKRAEANPDEVTVSWSSLKLYASRFFGESPTRLRGVVDVLAKLKMGELTMMKNDEGHEELSTIKLYSVQFLEDFAEFFQYHLFKGSRAEAIYVDPLALKVAKAFVELSAVAEVDHRGASKLDWTHLLTESKARFNLEIKNTHLDALERKGLFVKRQSFDDGRLQLSFDRPEFLKMSMYWSILYEIDKWNDRGEVLMVDPEEPMESAGDQCPSCQGKVDLKVQKFCPHCGFKLAA